MKVVYLYFQFAYIARESSQLRAAAAKFVSDLS